MTDLQRRILDLLSASGGGLCLAVLRKQLAGPQHLWRALTGLEASGAVQITQRSTAWMSSGPLIELSSARQSASADRASQTGPGTP